jgi:hypothetical protein
VERPRRGGEGALELFDQDQLHEERTSAGAIPPCAVCAKPTLRSDATGRPCHAGCEPADVGLTDVPTSRVAGARARRGSKSPLAKAILAELVKRGDDGATDDELTRVFDEQPPGSVSKRRCDLVRAGIVRDTGRTRVTRWGRLGIVWTVR